GIRLRARPREDETGRRAVRERDDAESEDARASPPAVRPEADARLGKARGPARPEAEEVDGKRREPDRDAGRLAHDRARAVVADDEVGFELELAPRGDVARADAADAIAVPEEREDLDAAAELEGAVLEE